MAVGGVSHGVVDELDSMAGSIEALINMDMRPPGHFASGMSGKLWRDAVALQGGYPILQAARRIIGSVGRGDVVIILTGFFVEDHVPCGENDGPLGAASIAYALNQGFGAIPVVLCEEEIVPVCQACLNAVGLKVREMEIARRIPNAAVVESYPVVHATAEARAKEIVETYQPKAVIAIERISLNRKGIKHTATGNAMLGRQAHTETLWAAAREQQVLTIGIGDFGNEVGLGTLVESIEKNNPASRTCRCGCGGGLAAAESADVAIVASTSNWGAYAISACLSAALRRSDLIHTGETEERMIEESIRAGAVDGGTGMHYLAVDGIPSKISAHVVDIMGHLVRLQQTHHADRGF